jgi:hypothetical protein
MEGDLMNEKSSSRWLMWAGPLFTVLFAVGVFGLAGDEPGEQASPAKIMNFFNSHQGRGMASVFATPLLVTLLLLFVTGLRARARRQGDSEVGTTVMLAGAILWSGGALLGSMFDLALLSSSHHHQPAVAQAATVLAAADWIPFIAGIAIFMIGAGLAVVGSRIVPVWLGWLALALGVVSLAGPGGFIGFFAGPLWILVVGIILAVRGADAPVTARPAAARPAPAVS